LLWLKINVNEDERFLVSKFDRFPKSNFLL
jgi:hypothetical protein